MISTNTGSSDGAVRVAVRELDLVLLRGSEQNAHHMPAHVFNQLVKNIQRDHTLTSVPLVVPEGEAFRIISGHHRVSAAVQAGLSKAWVMVVEGEVTRERLVAMQLSHNSLVGEDDVVKLREMWLGLPLVEQLYSGVTDDDFKMLGDLPDLPNLKIGTGELVQLTFSFAEQDGEKVLAALRSSCRAKKRTTHLIASAELFDVFFDALVEVKERKDIINSSVAIVVMAELAMRQLAADEREAVAAGEA